MKWPDFTKRTLFNDENYKLTWYRGESDIAVVAFGGIGLKMGGVQIEEFKNSLGTTCSRFFLIDKKRSWWNAGDVEKVFKVIDEKIAVQGLKKISAVGNSMGGSGALLLASQRPYVSRCVAFVPQAEVTHPNANEKRWEKFWNKIEKFNYSDFALKSDSCRTLVVYGGIGEEYPIGKFTQSGIRPFVYKNCGHNVARYMKEHRHASYRRLIRFLTFG